MDPPDGAGWRIPRAGVAAGRPRADDLPAVPAAAGRRATGASACPRPTATSGTSTGSTPKRPPTTRRSSCCSTASRAARARTTRCTLMALVARAGWRGVVPHFRGCGGELEPPAARLSLGRPRGDRRDARRDPRARGGGARRSTRSASRSAATRCSTGWAAPAPPRAARSSAAAAVSAPLDLMAAGNGDRPGPQPDLRAHFLSTLKPKSLAMATRFPGALDPARRRRHPHDVRRSTTR